jgi:hypothetical protein
MLAPQCVEKRMAFWIRLVVTFAAMLLSSWLASRIWLWVFHSDIPGYLSGAIGGITAVPVWELLRSWRRK